MTIAEENAGIFRLHWLLQCLPSLGTITTNKLGRLFLSLSLYPFVFTTIIPALGTSMVCTLASDSNSIVYFVLWVALLALLTTDCCHLRRDVLYLVGFPPFCLWLFQLVNVFSNSFLAPKFELSL